MESTLKNFSFRAMGSSCEIQFFAESRIDAKKLAKQLTDEVSRLESKYSRFKEDSFLSAMNSSAGEPRGIEIDEETLSLLNHAENCFYNSDGLFDVTAGALNEIWNFKQAVVPDRQQIQRALDFVGFDKLKLKNSRLTIPSGMHIDFGGIVKEYAADSVSGLARRLGVQHGLVNLGGDFSVIGPQHDNRPWRVGISRPDAQREVMAKIDLHEGGLASSGDYERFFVHEGSRYSHILNPKTGWPCAGLRAVSIAASLCTLAGSVATIAMLKDENESKTWLEESGLPYVYMDSEEEVFSSLAR